MPTYPYYPASYQPYQMPQYQVPQQHQTSIIWVSGEQEAQSYPVAPNNAVALWDNSGSVIYLKKADPSGKPTLTVYDLTERRQEAQEIVSEQTSYATKEELDALTAALDGLKRDLKRIQKAMRRDEDDE